MSDLIVAAYAGFAYILGAYVGYYANKSWGGHREREARLVRDVEKEKRYAKALEGANARLNRKIKHRDETIRLLWSRLPRRGSNGRFEKKAQK